MAKRTFLSDNAASVHPAILQAIADANDGHAAAYGDDEQTKAACEAFDALFGRKVHTFFVFNGTGANNVALCALTRSYGSILCAQTAHIVCDEVGAPEKLTGCHLHAVPTADGKVRPADFSSVLCEIGVQHHSQPSVIYISQCSELGTVYTLQEVRELADFAHAHGMKLLMDGARIANALVALGCSIADITYKAGVDAVVFGGTKNGLLFGEALIVFDEQIARMLPFIRKQNTQLASKMRYIAAQYNALLKDDLYLTNARHANGMAKKLERGLRALGAEFIAPVDANELFFRVGEREAALLQEAGAFHWNEVEQSARLVASFDTLQEDVDGFLDAAKRILGK